MLSENIKHISSEDIHDFKIEKTVINREEIPLYKRRFDFNNLKIATQDQAVKWNKCEKLSNFRVTTPVEYKTMLNYMSKHEICNDPKMKHFIAPFPFNIPIENVADRSPYTDDALWTFSSIFLAFKLKLIDGVNIFGNSDCNMCVKKFDPIIIVNKTKRKQVRAYFEKLFAPIDRIYESGHFDSTFKFTLYCKNKGRPLLRSTKTLEEHEEWYKNFKTANELRKLINPNFFISAPRQDIEKMTKPALVKLLAKSAYYSIAPKLWDRYGTPFEFETIEEVNKFKDKIIKEILGKIYNDTDLPRRVASFSIGLTNPKFETELQKINSLTSSLFM